MANFFSRLKDSWNLFTNNRDPTEHDFLMNSYSSSYRPDRSVITMGKEKTIVSAIITRIGIDISSIDIKHVKLDDKNRFISEIDSPLNRCLTSSANMDQSGRSLLLDATISMLDEGVVAIIPIDTSVDISKNSYDIYTMRVAEILEWYPSAIKVRVYNDRIGDKQDIIVDKKNAVILENPYFAIMNEPNSTMQRLIRKLAILDAIDEQSGSGKLDLIIQLPYIIRSTARQEQAENRRRAIEDQLAGSKYGIAYTDGTEKVTQLNRPADNNLMTQIEYLTNLLYSQLGINPTILDGTANESVLLNYNNRIIEPILSTIVVEMKRKWLTPTAITQKQSIMFFRDPFKLMPVEKLAAMADTLLRSRILTSNEFRQIIGRKPSEDPNADKLENPNLNHPGEQGALEAGQEIQNDEKQIIESE